jgi:hypothetical protein
MKPDIEGVEHSTHAGDSEVGLDMLLIVPAERRDDVGCVDPE